MWGAETLRPLAASPRPRRRVAVIGAGPAGCAAAHALRAAGREVVLFERSEAVGGRARTWREGDLAVDSGAGFFTNFYPTLWRLIRALGLRDQVVELSRTNFLSQSGRRAALSLGSVSSFLKFPLLGWRSKARMGLATAAAALRYRQLDLSAPESLSRLDDMSIRDDAVRRVGEDAYQVLVRSGIEPFWYFSCEEVSRSLALGLQARAATARFYTLRDGMDSICRALTRDVETRLAQAVAPLQPDRGGFRVGAPGKSEHFHEVVVATTASAARELTENLDLAQLGATARPFLESQRYVPNVHAAFLVERGRCPSDMSALFPCGAAERPLAAISFNSHKHQSGHLARNEVVSVFLTAAESRRVLSKSDAELHAHAWSLARELCPELPAQAEPFRVVARGEAIPVHAVGRYRLAAELLRTSKAPIVLAGDYLATATVDGALRSGLRAAQVLIRAAR